MKTNLSKYNKGDYKPGRNKLIVLLWYICNHLIFTHPFLPFSKFKTFILRLFGALIGHNLVIKPSVNIKYPWHLSVGNQVWIGEGVWIDNLTSVTIGNNCCISQGAMLLTGNHNYSKTSFDLMLGEIVLEDGVWIAAKAIVNPGLTCHSHAVLMAGSVATKNLDAFTIYQGNPATAKKVRKIT